MAPPARGRRARSVRSVAVLAASTVALLGCASEERPFLVQPPDGIGPTSSSTAPITTSTVVSSTTTPPAPLALVTPAGVVAPILEVAADGYLVQTPCQDEAWIVYGTPIGPVDVVLDPGHGGDVETGAVGPNGLAEKDLNLRLAKATARKLEARGVSVALTRLTDHRLPIVTRAQIADTLQAEALISIHHNAPAAARSSIPGTEVFYQSTSDESARLGGLIQQEVLDALGQFDDVQWVKAGDAGVVSVLRPDGSESYGMIRRPRLPAVLAELGYLANPSEAALFDTDEYIDAAAGALSEAIVRYLDPSETGIAPNLTNRTFTPSGGTGGTNNCVDPPLE